MADQEAKFVLSLDGDGSPLRAVFAKAKRDISSDVAEIERITGNVEIFRGMKDSLDKAAAELDTARGHLVRLKAAAEEVVAAGEPIGKALTAGLKEAARQVAATEREFTKQTAAADKMRASLAAAGVNTRALATEQARLAIELKQAQAAEATRQAAALLGIRLDRDRQAQIAQLVAAYKTLAASGTASYADLAAAQSAYRAKQAELSESNTGLLSGFQGLKASVLGYVAALAGAFAVMREGARSNIEFERDLARLGSVSTLTGRDLGALGDGIRNLAQTAGFELKEGLQAAYDLLRQGIPKDNILTILATADDAAKAGVTSLGNAAKLAGTLVKGFGVSADAVKPALEALFALSQRGGATLEELAGSLGSIAPLAAATKTPVQEVAAVVQVLTQAGLSGSEALSATEQVLLRLTNPEVTARLRGLGVEGHGLVDTLRQLGERGLAIDQLLGLEIASKKTAVAIAGLTADTTKLSTAMTIVGTSRGSIDAVAESLNRLRADALEKLSAALTNFSTTLGRSFTPSKQTLDTLTQLIILLNNIAAAADNAAAKQSNTADITNTLSRAIAIALIPLERYKLIFELLGVLANQTNERFAAAAKASTDAAMEAATTVKTVGDAEQELASLNAKLAEENAQGAAFAKARLNEIRGEILKIVPDLQAAAKLLQTMGQEELEAISTSAQLQVAALDKLRATEIENAEKSNAILTKAAEDKLAILKKSTADAIAAFNLEAEARRIAAGNSFKAQQQTEQDLAALKKTMLDGSLKGYQAYIASLIALETQHLNKVAELTNQRRSIEEEMEDRIRNIRSSGLSAYDRFNQSLRDIDENTSKARQALSEGDFTAAERYARKAIDLSESIKGGVESDGRSIVSALQGQELAVTKVKGAYDVLLSANKERTRVEKDGADGVSKSLTEAIGDANGLKTQLVEISRIMKEELRAKVFIDAAEAVDAARNEIDSLNGRDTYSTHHVKVQYEDGSGVPTSSSGGGNGEHFARGGLVVGRSGRNHAASMRADPVTWRDLATAFAVGGPVFRRPTWRKVPGIGNRDTVPAALPSGGFVIRKAAAQFYGDGLLSRLTGGGPVVQRFAGGGNIPGPGSIAGRILIGPGGRVSLGGISGEYRDTIDGLFKIKEHAQNLAHSSTGLDIGEWAGRILNKFESFDDTRKKRIQTAIAESLDGWLQAIELGRRQGAPVVMEAGLAALAFRLGGRLRGFTPSGSDTVPAMLTPGEWVINRAAVSRYGEALMHSINSMALPRESLGRVLERPTTIARFAEGGPVGSSIEFTPGPGPTAAAGNVDRGITVNLNASAADLFSLDNVRRYLIPALDEIDRRRSRA